MAVTLGADRLAEALRQVVPAASTDDSRPILTGVLMAAEDGGLRLVATDSYRLAVRDLPGASVLGRGPERAGAVPALGELARVLGRRRRGHPAPGRARRHLRGRRRAAHHPADRGRVPELPGAHPVEPPEPAHGRARGPARRRAPGQAAGPGGDAGAPVDERRRARAHAITQDVGQAHEELDAKYEGTELTWRSTPSTCSPASRSPRATRSRSRPSTRSSRR